MERNRQRRLRLFALPFVFSAFLAWGSVHQVWYTAVMRPTVVQSQTVHASITLTAAQIAQLNTTPAPATPGGLAATNANPSVGVKFGLIDPIFLVLMGAGIGILGSLLGSLLLTAASLAAQVFAWMQLTSLRASFENPVTTTGFNILRGPGQARLWLALSLSLGFGLLATVQAYLVHHAKRVASSQPGLVTTLLTALTQRAIPQDTSASEEVSSK